MTRHTPWSREFYEALQDDLRIIENSDPPTDERRVALWCLMSNLIVFDRAVTGLRAKPDSDHVDEATTAYSKLADPETMEWLPNTMSWVDDVVRGEFSGIDWPGL